MYLALNFLVCMGIIQLAVLPHRTGSEFPHLYCIYVSRFRDGILTVVQYTTLRRLARWEYIILVGAIRTNPRFIQKAAIMVGKELLRSVPPIIEDQRYTQRGDCACL